MADQAQDKIEALDDTLFREQTVMRDEQLSTSMTDGSSSSWRSGAAPGSEDSDSSTPRVLKQRFVLEELIGSGGMGSVYRAKDLRKVEARDSKPYIAVKVLNNDFRKHPEAFIALEREASKSQGLRHTNVVSIFDYDKDGEVPFIAMELLEGTELAELLRAYPTGLPEEQAWQVIQDMVSGLAHAHEEHVVHADFKPGNVFVTKRQTKILDFGIARAMRLNQGGKDTDFDPARLAALTPAYASREMLNGDNPEPRDDLYSLGIVIYLVLTGHHPYGRVPADQAALENLEPERVKHISRRRWKILRQCLQFNRQARPASAADVLEGLFGKSAWKSWSIAAAGGVLALGALLFTFQEQAAMDEVKQEVRQEALVDAQVARIGALLSEPQFDENWQRTLFSEARTLNNLGSSPSESGDILSQIENVYIEHISELESLPLAFTQLDIARRFGDMQRVEVLMQQRLLGELDMLVQMPVNNAWLGSADTTLVYAGRYFPRDAQVATARESLVDHLQGQMLVLIEGGEIDLAEQAWSEFNGRIFDEEAWTLTWDRMQEAVAKRQAQQKRSAAQARLVALQGQLDDLLERSCLRLDVNAIGQRLDKLGAGSPGNRQVLRDKVGSRIGQCVAQLGAVDAARAQSLHGAAVQRLGSLAALNTSAVDPCSMHYLVGNGHRSGRGGYCADVMAKGDSGPQLVVVPGVNNLPKFAISRFEVSANDWTAYCAAASAPADLCSQLSSSGLPVVGLSPQQATSYAAWLSKQTGRLYRLPTVKEWSLAAHGVVTGIERCDSNAANVAPGELVPQPVADGNQNVFGLVFALGNVNEWVRGRRGPAVMASMDDQSSCVQSAQSDKPTGFRLVRELS